MSEADILEQLFSLYDRYWVIVQWWASVSFGIIMIAHLASEKLSAFILLTILVLYTVYSLWLYFLLDYNLAITFGLIDELSSLGDAGRLTAGGQETLVHPSGKYGVLLGMFALPITFLACAGYLVFSYVHARKST
ncbi:MAG: hypothetical protein ABJK20_15835 [Halieaceae bacterium]